MGYRNKKKEILGKEYTDDEEEELLDRIAEDFTIKEWNSLTEEEKKEYMDNQ